MYPRKQKKKYWAKRMYTHQIHHLFLRPTQKSSLTLSFDGLPRTAWWYGIVVYWKTTKVLEEVSMCTKRWSHVGHLEGLLSFRALLSDPLLHDQRPLAETMTVTEERKKNGLSFLFRGYGRRFMQNAASFSGCLAPTHSGRPGRPWICLKTFLCLLAVGSGPWGG